MSVKYCPANGEWKGDAGIHTTHAEAERAESEYRAGKAGISGSIQEMAANEIKQYIDPGKYEEIKKTDKTPLFKAFVVGHEGQSSGALLGRGNIVKRWFSNVIQALHDKLDIGREVFRLHQKGTNENIGRVGIGQIVGKTIQKIQDKLNVFGILYIKPEYRTQTENDDIVSVEADIKYKMVAPDTVDVESVTDISGVVLGNSTIHKPGFPGATLQGALQEMANEK